MRALGIDPGTSGMAIALVEDGIIKAIGDQDNFCLKVKRGAGIKSELDLRLVKGVLDGFLNGAELRVLLEKVGPMPKQGVTSSFQFGGAFRGLEGLCLGMGLNVELVRPQVWQKAMGVRPGEDGTRQRALDLFPGQAGLFARKKDHNRADAALLALWGCR